MTLQREIGKTERISGLRRFQEFLKGHCIRLPGQGSAPCRGKLDNPLPAVGAADHPPQRRKFFGLEVSCGDAVGGDHEILNNLLGPVLFFGFQVLEVISVEYWTCLYGFEIKGAVQVPEGLEFLGPSGPGVAGSRRDL